MRFDDRSRMRPAAAAGEDDRPTHAGAQVNRSPLWRSAHESRYPVAPYLAADDRIGASGRAVAGKVSPLQQPVRAPAVQPLSSIPVRSANFTSSLRWSSASLCMSCER
jgi:hypothetical protein